MRPPSSLFCGKRLEGNMDDRCPADSVEKVLDMPYALIV
jgi:hypothetical protein